MSVSSLCSSAAQSVGQSSFVVQHAAEGLLLWDAGKCGVQVSEHFGLEAATQDGQHKVLCGRGTGLQLVTAVLQQSMDVVLVVVEQLLGTGQNGDATDDGGTIIRWAASAMIQCHQIERVTSQTEIMQTTCTKRGAVS